MILNSRVSVLKISSVDKKSEKFLIFSAILQISISIVLSALNYIFLLSNKEIAQEMYKIQIPQTNEYFKILMLHLVTFMRWMLLST